MALLIGLTLLCAACSSAPRDIRPPTVNPPRRLLFIGNSFTYYNGGIDRHVQQLAASTRSPRFLETDRATKGGATLKILNGMGWVHERIRDGRHDIVILQEDIPELTEHSVVPFLEHVRLFDREIRGAGGRTALFMAWPYERLNWATLEQIEQAHRTISRELGIPVAPVGAAFRNAKKARPGLAMLGPDKEHETVQGSYLAACVIASAVLGLNPEGATYHPPGVSAEEATFLQQIATVTVKEWNRTR
jgi:hypothetical protein